LLIETIFERLDKMTRIRWTEEMLFAEARKYQTRSEFKKGSASAYGACKDRGLLDQACSHMVDGTLKWTNEMLFAEAKKYQTRGAFCKGSKSAYNACVVRGILDQACSHMNNVLTYWTNEMLFAEARKYQTRYDFRKGSKGAYDACHRRGILDQACSHMVDVLTYWTNEMIFAEAKKYQTRGAFQKGSKQAYSACLKRGIEKEAFAHMVSGLRSSDNDAVYIWRAVGESYKSMQVYKVGVTSARSNNDRIDVVSRYSGFKAEIIALLKTSIKATKVEKFLLQMGESPEYSGFNGASEFRAMSEEELNLALSILYRNEERELLVA